MGEYCTRLSDNESVKMGTCADMYYIRFEDMAKVEPENNSSFGSRFRLPWPDEDHHLPGDYANDYEQGGYRELDITIQYVDGEIKLFVPAPEQFRGSGDFYRLTAVRWFDDCLYPVVSSYMKEDDDQFRSMQTWRDTWSNVFPFIDHRLHGELKGRLYFYSIIPNVTHAFSYAS